MAKGCHASLGTEPSLFPFPEEIRDGQLWELHMTEGQGGGEAAGSAKGGRRAQEAEELGLQEAEQQQRQQEGSSFAALHPSSEGVTSPLSFSRLSAAMHGLGLATHLAAEVEGKENPEEARRRVLCRCHANKEVAVEEVLDVAEEPGAQPYVVALEPPLPGSWAVVPLWGRGKEAESDAIRRQRVRRKPQVLLLCLPAPSCASRHLLVPFSAAPPLFPSSPPRLSFYSELFPCCVASPIVSLPNGIPTNRSACFLLCWLGSCTLNPV